MRTFQKQNRIKRTVLSMCILVVVLFGLVLPFFSVFVAYGESVLAYDKTDVLNDLRDCTIDGKPFDIEDFPFDQTGQKPLQIISFVEYSYTFRFEHQGNYGLYIYVYNPQALDIDVNSKSNRIQLATKYDTAGNPVDYSLFELKFCSKTTGAVYGNLFYKFKILDPYRDILERVNDSLTGKNNYARRYDVSSVLLFPRGAVNATDWKVAYSLTYTGFAAGCGIDLSAESALSCSVKDLETLSLEVHQTHFRPEIVSSAGKGHQNNLSSVFFSVPNRYIEDYGRLQKIKAEWWEYKTQSFLATQNANLFSALSPFLGVDVGTGKDRQSDVFEVGYSLHSEIDWWAVTHMHGTAQWGWNHYYGRNLMRVGIVNPCRVLTGLYYTSNISSEISSAEVLQGLYDYDKSYRTGRLWIKDSAISNDLFIDVVDSGRTRGYQVREFDADNVDDQFDLMSYDSNHSGWQKFWEYGFWSPKTSGDFMDIAPIYKVTAADLVGSNAEISQKLYIDVGDVPDFKIYCGAQMLRGESVFLFRFASTDYFSEKVYYFKGDVENPSTSFQSYRFQQTAFLDFRIIQLTFNKDGLQTVIPVVCSPIDIIGPATAPLKPLGCLNIDWKKLLLILFVLIICFLVVLPNLGEILQGAWYVITRPFAIIGNIFDSSDHKGGRR